MQRKLLALGLAMILALGGLTGCGDTGGGTNSPGSATTVNPGVIPASPDDDDNDDGTTSPNNDDDGTASPDDDGTASPDDDDDDEGMASPTR